MKLLNKSLLKLVAIVIFTTISVNGFSQCKNFTKKVGFPALKPYIHNGQLTSARFVPGDEAEIEMTFNGGNDYRVLVCRQEVLGEVELTILDKARKVLYTSKPGGENPNWDFRVKNTQQLIVQVKVAEMDKNAANMVPNGCVSILVGFRDSSVHEKMLKLSH